MGFLNLDVSFSPQVKEGLPLLPSLTSLLSCELLQHAGSLGGVPQVSCASYTPLSPPRCSGWVISTQYMSTSCPHPDSGLDTGQPLVSTDSLCLLPAHLPEHHHRHHQAFPRVSLSSPGLTGKVALSNSPLPHSSQADT